MGNAAKVILNPKWYFPPNLQSFCPLFSVKRRKYELEKKSSLSRAHVTQKELKREIDTILVKSNVAKKLKGQKRRCFLQSAAEIYFWEICLKRIVNRIWFTIKFQQQRYTIPPKKRNPVHFIAQYWPDFYSHWNLIIFKKNLSKICCSWLYASFDTF